MEEQPPEPQEPLLLDECLSLNPQTLFPRTLAMTALQTLAMLILYTALAVCAPLGWELFVMLAAWTAVLAFIAFMVAVHIFKEVIEDAGKLALQVYVATSTAESFSYLLVAHSFLSHMALFLCLSLTAQCSVLLASLYLSPVSISKYGPRLIIWSLIFQSILVLTAFSLSYILVTVVLMLVDCVYLIVGLDETVRLTKGKEGGWKEAAKWALIVQNRKFACPLWLLPVTLRSKLEDFLPVGENY